MRCYHCQIGTLSDIQVKGRYYALCGQDACREALNAYTEMLDEYTAPDYKDITIRHDDIAAYKRQQRDRWAENYSKLSPEMKSYIPKKDRPY